MAHILGQLHKKECLVPQEFRGQKKPLGPQKSLHPPRVHSLPCLMRLTLLNPHLTHRLVLTPRLLTSPTGGGVNEQYKVFSHEKFLNDKGVMTRTLTLERRILTESLPTMTEIHNLFTRHRLEWRARSLGRYSEVVREFYASYMATLISQIDKQAAPAKQPH